MSKYTVSYLFPKTKHPFPLTMKTALNEIEEKKILFEKHIEEYVSRGYELISTTNLGYGLWFFWRKV